MGVCSGASGNLLAQSTIFGWILSGPLTISSPQVFHISAHHAMDASLDKSLTRFWEMEEIPLSNALTKAEQYCEDHFSQSFSRNSDGRYIVKLPFSKPPSDLGDSLHSALVSFNSLEKKLSSNVQLSSQYSDFMQDYESLSHMTCVGPVNESSMQNVFIPHHQICRESSQTTKLRVVFNASHPTSTKVSLNDCLHAGPKLQQDISSIILGWREHKFVLCADIAHMFRQILVHPDDRKFQHILWRESMFKPISVYELNTVTYGMTCAPYLAIRVLRQLAADEQSKFPLAASVLCHDSYVDDIFLGGSNKSSTLLLRDQMIELTRSGGFTLRKWFSNDPELLVGLSDVDHGLAVEIPLDNSSGFKVLGIFWDPKSDAFIYRFSQLPSETPSKRSILSAVAKLFDPMGWICPVIVTAKILLQKLWLRKLNWDDALPSDLIHEWNEFYTKLSMLSRVSIPRWIDRVDNSCSIQIHGFSDASSVAYAAAVYSRVTTPSGSTSVQLLMARTKVAPLKTVSIPRLELCAANLLTNLVNFVIKSLNLNNVQIFCWTDSSVVLSWLQQQPVTWTVFVADRVSAIQTNLPTAIWNHVPSKDNPADCASRGLTADKLSSFSLWWNGPSWLSEPSATWPKRNFDNVETENEKRVSSHSNVIDKNSVD